MENTKQFIEALVKIELLDDGVTYGYYPFHLIAEKANGKLDFNSLALGGDVLACYKRFKHYVDSGALKIFMAVDFPAHGEINNDFACVFSMIEGEFSVCAMPYSTATGEVFEVFEKTKLLEVIKKQFLSVINS